MGVAAPVSPARRLPGGGRRRRGGGGGLDGTAARSAAGSVAGQQRAEEGAGGAAAVDAAGAAGGRGQQHRRPAAPLAAVRQAALPPCGGAGEEGRARGCDAAAAGPPSDEAGCRRLRAVWQRGRARAADGERSRGARVDGRLPQPALPARARAAPRLCRGWPRGGVGADRPLGAVGGDQPSRQPRRDDAARGVARHRARRGGREAAAGCVARGLRRDAAAAAGGRADRRAACLALQALLLPAARQGQVEVARRFRRGGGGPTRRRGGRGGFGRSVALCACRASGRRRGARRPAGGGGRHNGAAGRAARQPRLHRRPPLDPLARVVGRRRHRAAHARRAGRVARCERRRAGASHAATPAAHHVGAEPRARAAVALAPRLRRRARQRPPRHLGRARAVQRRCWSSRRRRPRLARGCVPGH
mmetsp:Transcript_42452/g.136527  ORF Transcript_42452/g.136527 Transcript_42452/m.136527 type:complete len:418 (+) Transcript_42452:815-2068(+)